MDVFLNQHSKYWVPANTAAARDSQWELTLYVLNCLQETCKYIFFWNTLCPAPDGFTLHTAKNIIKNVNVKDFRNPLLLRKHI